MTLLPIESVEVSSDFAKLYETDITIKLADSLHSLGSEQPGIEYFCMDDKGTIYLCVDVKIKHKVYTIVMAMKPEWARLTQEN